MVEISLLLGKFELKKMSKKIIIGLGNQLKCDDNIGNLIVKELGNTLKDKDLIFIQGETTPENYLVSLQKYEPEIIYFIDAVDFNGKVGEIKIFTFDDILNLNLSTTHTIPITLFKKYYENIKLIGIKVKNTDFGNDLTKELRKEYKNIVERIKKII
jgi:hydrogenase 3 maturation protease